MEMPKFAHIPLILNPGGGKLSKRHSHATVDTLREKDYFPEAVVNFVALLGWKSAISLSEAQSQATRDEIYKLEELVELFSLARINAMNTKMLESKLVFFNAQRLRKTLSPIDDPKAPPEDKVKAVEEFTKYYIKYNPTHKDAIEDLTETQMNLIIPYVRDRIKQWEELTQYSFFVATPDFSTEFAKQGREKVMKDVDKTKELINEMYRLLNEKVPKKEFNVLNIAKTCGEWVFSNKEKYNSEEFYHLLRYMLTGRFVGGPVTLVCEILGREETLKRVKVWL